MRRIYIHQHKNWPQFEWDGLAISSLLAETRHLQGRLLGRMESLGFSLQSDAALQMLTLELVKSSEIEGELLPADQVRSSIARKLGMEIAGLVASDRNVDGVVEMMLDATRNNKSPLSADRLFGWHTCLFPGGSSSMHTIKVGAWRKNAADDPMQVESGGMGREKVHFEAPASLLLGEEMQRFVQWFNENNDLDAVLKAAVAHFWFVTIHPFDDGNGRMARAITDLQLCRADNNAQRFYSMSAQISKERQAYYNILEKTQQGSLDITGWIKWFLACLGRALSATGEVLGVVQKKANFWEGHAKTLLNSRQVLVINKLLDGFEGKLNSSKWAKIAKCSQDTALRDIQDLLFKQVLVSEGAGGRSTSYRVCDPVGRDRLCDI